MEAWKEIESKAVPLLMDHVDTDMIIPAQYLTSTSKSGFSEGLFKRLKDEDANFILNREPSHEKSILVAGDNFGCGSSREHAVWALMEYGFKCVIAKSFGDIFKANALKNGLLPISVSEQRYAQILEGIKTESSFQVDLDNQHVNVDGKFLFRFEIDPFRKHCLLQGIDDLEYILNLEEKISEFRKRQENQRFFKTTWAVK